MTELGLGLGIITIGLGVPIGLALMTVLYTAAKNFILPRLPGNKPQVDFKVEDEEAEDSTESDT